MRNKKFVAFGEMFLLISLSFAVSFIFAEEVGVVSGADLPKGYGQISTTPNAGGAGTSTTEKIAEQSFILKTEAGVSTISSRAGVAKGAVLGPGTVLSEGTATLSNGAILQAGQAV